MVGFSFIYGWGFLKYIYMRGRSGNYDPTRFADLGQAYGGLGYKWVDPPNQIIKQVVFLFELDPFNPLMTRLFETYINLKILSLKKLEGQLAVS